MGLRRDQHWLKDWGVYDPVDVEWGPLVVAPEGSILLTGINESAVGDLACVYTQTLAPPAMYDGGVGAPGLRQVFVLNYNFEAAYTPPTDGFAFDFATAGSTHQNVYPLGFENFAAGWVTTVSWRQFASGVGGIEAGSFGRAKFRERFSRNHDFNAPYEPPPGDAINHVWGGIGVRSIPPGEFGLLSISNGIAEIKPQGFQNQAFGQHWIYNYLNYVIQHALPTTAYGAVTIYNRNRFIVNVQASTFTGAIGSHKIQWSLQVVKPPSIELALVPPQISRDHIVHPFEQWVSYNQSIVSGTVGTPSIGYRVRAIVPPPITSTEVGRPSVSRALAPMVAGGIPPGAMGDVVVYYDTDWVDVLSMDAGTYGFASIRNQHSLVFPPSTPLGTLPAGGFGLTVLQLQQRSVYPWHETPYPYTEYGLPYKMSVLNVDREVGAFGHRDSRFGWATLELRARLLQPKSIAPPVLSSQFIGYRIRSVLPLSFYDGVVVDWNIVTKTPEIFPEGFDASQYGVPSLASNLQTLYNAGGSGPEEYGPATFIADRIRSVFPPSIVETGTANTLHDVALFTRRIVTKSFPDPFWTLDSGPIYVEEHFTLIVPKSIIPAEAWAPQLAHIGNKDRVIDLPPRDGAFTEYGYNRIINKIQHVNPKSWTGAMGLTWVMRGPLEIHPSPFSLARIVDIHRIQKLTADPPSTRTLVAEGIRWHAEWYFGYHALRYNLIYPASFVSGTVSSPSLIANILDVDEWMLDLDRQVPPPSLNATQYIWNAGGYPDDDEARQLVPEPHLWPHYILAPDPQYPVDADTYPTDGDWAYGSPWPWFSRFIAVSHRHRALQCYHLPPQYDDTVGATKWGLASVQNKRRVVSPRRIPPGFVGHPSLPADVVIDLDAEHDGIPPYNFSEEPDRQHKIGWKPPYTQVLPINSIYSTGFGNNRIELFNRALSPPGFLATKWGWDSWYFGYRPTEIHPPWQYGGINDSVVGDKTWVSYLHRSIEAIGDDMLEIDSHPLFYDQRMRVTMRNYMYTPYGWDSSVFGKTSISTWLRYVHATGWRAGWFGAAPSLGRGIQCIGWDSSVFGDIDRWEPNKIKVRGYNEMSSYGRTSLASEIHVQGIYGTLFGNNGAANRLDLTSFGIPQGAFGDPVRALWYDGCDNHDKWLVGYGIEPPSMPAPTKVEIIDDGSIRVYGIYESVVPVPSLTKRATIAPISISQSAVGSPRLSTTVAPISISDGAVGTPFLSRTVRPISIDQSAVGTPMMVSAIRPLSIYDGAVGTPRLGIQIRPAGWVSLDMTARYVEDGYGDPGYADQNNVTVEHK